MTDRKYLRRKGNIWQVRLPVPKHLWGVMGKRALIRSTGTGDIRDANRRKFAIIAELQEDIERAANADPATAGWLDDQAEALRASVKRGELDSQLAGDIISDLRDRHLHARGQSPEDNLKPAQLTHLRRATRIASDMKYRPLSEAIEDYLTEKASSLRASTVDAKRRHLEMLTGWLQGDPDLNEVTRKVAAQFVSEVLVPRNVAAKTKKDTVTVLSTFFNFASRRAWYDHANPFSGLGADLNGSTRGGVKPEKRRWTDKELAKLFREIPAGPKYYLREMAAVALYTGARMNEIAELQVTDIDLEDKVIHIREGKSRAAVRDVPLHSKLDPVFRELIGERTDGYLFDTLKPTGRDKLRGHEPSKRFGYWLRKAFPELVLTLPNGRTYAVCDFHSFRRAFTNAMELAGVPEPTAQQIVGHSKSGKLTYGTYSKGVSMELLREAVHKVDFGFSSRGQTLDLGVISSSP